MNASAAKPGPVSGVALSPHPCGLLVSVRDAFEAAAALAGGATVVDVKEPARGSLGTADPEAAAAVAAVVGRRVPWTLACGELRDGIAALHAHVRRVVGLLPAGAVPPCAAKAGPAGTGAAGWRDMLVAFGRGLPPGVAPVAVAYADWERAAAPTPDDVLAAAGESGFGLLLLDTFDKAGPPLLADSAAVRRVAGWVDRARAAGMRVVLAGSLTAVTAREAVACGPDLIAVRSAACTGGRLGTVCEKRVARLGKLCGPSAAEPAGDLPEVPREIARGASAPQCRS
jgi:uncharacterized protein (UPF0264 family)